MPDTNWLNDDEMRLWRAFIEATTRINQELESDLKASAGLTFDDYEVLVYLTEAPDMRLRMSELSELLVHSRSRLTQRIDRMEKRGLVCREQCPADRRSTFAVVTPAGLQAIAEAAPGHVESVRRNLLDHVDETQLPVVTEMLEQIVAAQRAKR